MRKTTFRSYALLAAASLMALTLSNSLHAQKTVELHPTHQGECSIVDDVAVLFAPFTPEAHKQAVLAGFAGGPDYRVQTRWSTTASGPTGARGNPITLTWSLPADGITISGGGSLGSGPNTMRASLAARFGSLSAGIQRIQDSLNYWSYYAGVTYVYEPNDSGAWPNSAGVLGVRGDVRIVAYQMTSTGVVAFNYFPNGGDMALNTRFATSWNNFNFFTNAITHENGHGLGFDHVGPINRTKLMEAQLATNFTGPQHDDIRAGNRNYGDVLEKNDSPDRATYLGGIYDGLFIGELSLDDRLEQDWLLLETVGGANFLLQLTPSGFSYLEGPQSGPFNPIDSSSISRLGVVAYDSSFNLIGYGEASVLGETVYAEIAPTPGDPYIYLQVFAPSGQTATQLYWMWFYTSFARIQELPGTLASLLNPDLGLR